jgi:hypothetical protein
VNCRRPPETAGRWASFWHLLQEGPVEHDRTPTLRRCERIRWVVENGATHVEIDEWQNSRGTEVNAALSCLDVRPLIKGYFSALRWSRVRSCLRPSFAENRIRWP